MRCTRCDRPILLQSVGRADQGTLVFGWCLDCMREAGCQEIVVALRPRRPSMRLTLDPRPSRASFLGMGRGARLGGARGVMEDRRRSVRAVAFGLAGWGFSLVAFGLSLSAGRDRAVSPLGNGTPALMYAGGVSTILVGLLLLTLARRDRGHSTAGGSA